VTLKSRVVKIDYSIFKISSLVYALSVM
jgi:hypothetical protein